MPVVEAFTKINPDFIELFDQIGDTYRLKDEFEQFEEIIMMMMYSKKPIIDHFTSHEEVYYFVRALYRNNCKKTLDMFVGWAKLPEWSTFPDPEYLYGLAKISDELVDWVRYFTDYDDGFSIIRKMDKLSIYDSDDYLQSREFFFNIRNTNLIDYSDEVQKKILLSFEHHYNDLLVDIYRLAPSHWTYTPVNDPVYSCKNLTQQPTLKPGDRTVVSRAEFEKRLNELTVGILEHPEFRHSVLAGGFVLGLVRDHFDLIEGSDIDLWVPNIECTKETFRKNILAAGTKGKCYYATRGSVATVYNDELMHPVQLISIFQKQHACYTIHTFDLDYIQICYEISTRRVLATPACVRSLKTLATGYCSTRNITEKRIFKALIKGYDLLANQDTEQTFEFKIDELIEDRQKVLTATADFHAKFMPKPGMNENFVMGMLLKETPNYIVTRDIEAVLDNITIGGKFNREYSSEHWATCNYKLIATLRNNFYCGSNLISFRIFTDPLEVSMFEITDEGIDMYFIVQPEFADFVNKKLITHVNGKVHKRGNWKKRENFQTEGELIHLKTHISMNKLRFHEEKGIPILRTQYGRALDIKEDLAPGDKVQLLLKFKGNKYVEQFRPHIAQMIKKNHAEEIEATNNDMEKDANEATAEAGEVDYAE